MREDAKSDAKGPKEEALGLNLPSSSEQTKKFVSLKKLSMSCDPMEENPCEQESASKIAGFRFVDIELMSTAFSATRCADCGD